MKKQEMMRCSVVIGLAVILASALQGKAASGGTRRTSSEQTQQDGSSPEAQLRIRLAKDVLVLNEPGHLELSVRNLSSVPLYVQSTYPERDYQFDLRDEHGESVPFSETGKHLVENTSVYKNVGIKLGPRDHYEESINLTEMYNFSGSGNYTVRVKRKITREDGSGFEITSRLLRFRVAAPASK